MRPAVSNETILVTKQEFFFTNVAPVQSLADIVLLHFWSMLFSWMFISSYSAIHFFVKKFHFFESLCLGECVIGMSVYGFWLRKGPSIKYMHHWWWGEGVIQNAYNCVQGEGVSQLMCTYASTLSPFMLLAAFLSYSVLFYL